MLPITMGAFEPPPDVPDVPAGAPPDLSVLLPLQAATQDTAISKDTDTAPIRKPRLTLRITGTRSLSSRRLPWSMGAPDVTGSPVGAK
jgi:hypothetical protein